MSSRGHLAQRRIADGFAFSFDRTDWPLYNGVLPTQHLSRGGPASVTASQKVAGRTCAGTCFILLF
jgi:hypothetical protein